MTVQYFIAFFSEQAPHMEPHCLCRYNYQARLIAASQSFENKMINDLFVFNIKTISQCVYSLSALSQQSQDMLQLLHNLLQLQMNDFLHGSWEHEKITSVEVYYFWCTL